MNQHDLRVLHQMFKARSGRRQKIRNALALVARLALFVFALAWSLSSIATDLDRGDHGIVAMAELVITSAVLIAATSVIWKAGE